MKCTKSIPCQIGGSECCIQCKLKCEKRCDLPRRIKCFLTAYRVEILIGYCLAILIAILLMQARFNQLEAEHNAIIDRLDQVENTIVETIEEYHPSEEFTDGEEVGD